MKKLLTDKVFLEIIFTILFVILVFVIAIKLNEDGIKNCINNNGKVVYIGKVYRGCVR